MMLETQSITVEREQAYTCSIGERLASLFWLKTLGSICAISSFFADRNLLFGGDSRRGEGSRERGDLN